MHKKDLGLLVLILVVGAFTAALNPRFLSPVNLVNMANLIGLFGLDKLYDVDGTVRRIEEKLTQATGATS